MRVSLAYGQPDMIIAAQNLVWPEKPDYSNPIVAIYHKEEYCRFKF